MVEAGDKQGLLESVIARLNRRKGQWREIGELGEVPYDTVSKIARRKIPEPGVLKIERLDRVLGALDETDKKLANSPQLSLALNSGR